MSSSLVPTSGNDHNTLTDSLIEDTADNERRIGLLEGEIADLIDFVEELRAMVNTHTVLLKSKQKPVLRSKGRVIVANTVPPKV